MSNINISYDFDLIAKMKLYNLSRFEGNNVDYSLKPPDILPIEVFIELEHYF